MLRLGVRAASMRMSCPPELSTSRNSPRIAETELGTSLMSSERRSAVTVIDSSWGACWASAGTDMEPMSARRTKNVQGLSFGANGVLGMDELPGLFVLGGRLGPVP